MGSKMKRGKQRRCWELAVLREGDEEPQERGSGTGPPVGQEGGSQCESHTCS